MVALNSLHCADVPLSNYSLTHCCIGKMSLSIGNIIEVM